MLTAPLAIASQSQATNLRRCSGPQRKVKLIEASVSGGERYREPT
jgi:hypothetical protein